MCLKMCFFRFWRSFCWRCQNHKYLGEARLSNRVNRISGSQEAKSLSSDVWVRRWKFCLHTYLNHKLLEHRACCQCLQGQAWVLEEFIRGGVFEPCPSSAFLLLLQSSMDGKKVEHILCNLVAFVPCILFIFRERNASTVVPPVFLGGFSSKESACQSGDLRDSGLISGLGRSPRGGHAKPLQCSCLENPMDRGAWWATVHRVAKS